MYKNILLPTDGSPLALKGVKSGIGLAKALNARVTAFYADPGIGPEFAAIDAPLPEQVLEAEIVRLRKLGERYLSAVRKLADAAGVPSKCIGLSNLSAYEGIIATARKERCDLICMASHGRTALKGMLLGNVAQQVLSHSKTPVLIVRA